MKTLGAGPGIFQRGFITSLKLMCLQFEWELKTGTLVLMPSCWLRRLSSFSLLKGRESRVRIPELFRSFFQGICTWKPLLKCILKRTRSRLIHSFLVVTSSSITLLHRHHEFSRSEQPAPLRDPPGPMILTGSWAGVTCQVRDVWLTYASAASRRASALSRSTSVMASLRAAYTNTNTTQVNLFHDSW